MRVRQEAANVPVFLPFLPFLGVAFSSFNANSGQWFGKRHFVIKIQLSTSTFNLVALLASSSRSYLFRHPTTISRENLPRKFIKIN